MDFRDIVVICIFISLFSFSVTAKTFEWDIYAGRTSELNWSGSCIRDWEIYPPGPYELDKCHGSRSINEGILKTTFDDRFFIYSTGQYMLKRVDVRHNSNDEGFNFKLDDSLFNSDLFPGKNVEFNLNKRYNWFKKDEIDIVNKVADSFTYNILDSTATCGACEFWTRILFTFIDHTKSFQSAVTVRDEVKPIGNIKSLLGNYRLLFNVTRVWNSPVGIASADPKVLLSLSESTLRNSENGNYYYADATDPSFFNTVDDFEDAVVYACLDEDEDNICDFVLAEQCWNDGGDFYKDKCCGGTTPDVILGNYDSEIDAFCTKDKSQNPVFIPLNDIGEIFELSQASVASNGNNFLYCGNTVPDLPNTIKIQDNSFKEIKVGDTHHYYYCNNKQLLECGGDSAFSSINYAETGDKLETSKAINGETIFYCADYIEPTEYSYEHVAKWLSSLDNFEVIPEVFPVYVNMSKSCEAAGFTFTGTRCCGENTGEYYNDSWSITPLSDTHGLCENSIFVEDGNIYDNDKYIAYNGSSYVCKDNFCQNYLSNVDDENNFAICTPQGWIKDNETDIVGLIPKVTSWNSSDSFCCKQDECWNGNYCVGQNDNIYVDSQFFICKNGNWIHGFPKFDLKGSQGFCLSEQQCLVDQSFNISITNKNSYWNDKDSEKPMCINSGDYILDNYCNYGSWTSRTAFVADELYNMLNSFSSNFAIYCSSPENTLLNTDYSVNGEYVDDLIFDCEINNKHVPCTNNFCVAVFDGKAVIGTSLNTPIDDSDRSFLLALDRNKNSCNSYKDSNRNYEECFNGFFYNHDIETIIYSPYGFVNNPGTFSNAVLVNKFNPIKTYVDSLNGEYSFFANPTFNNIYLEKKGTKEIFSFLELNRTLANVNYVGLDFYNTVLPETACSNIKDDFRGVSCNKDSQNHFYLIASDVQTSARFPSALPPLTDFWSDLSGKVRLR